MTVYDNALELYNEYLDIYFDEYKALSDAKKGKLGNKYDPINLFLKHITMMSGLKMKNPLIQLQKKVKDKSVDLSDMLPLEGDEVKGGKGLKIFTPNKFLTKLPILLAQIKAGQTN